jgi:hypothetical protein
MNEQALQPQGIAAQEQVIVWAHTHGGDGICRCAVRPLYIPALYGILLMQ